MGQNNIFSLWLSHKYIFQSTLLLQSVAAGGDYKVDYLLSFLSSRGVVLFQSSFYVIVIIMYLYDVTRSMFSFCNTIGGGVWFFFLKFTVILFVFFCAKFKIICTAPRRKFSKTNLFIYHTL